MEFNARQTACCSSGAIVRNSSKTAVLVRSCSHWSRSFSPVYAVQGHPLVGDNVYGGMTPSWCGRRAFFDLPQELHTSNGLQPRSNGVQRSVMETNRLAMASNLVARNAANAYVTNATQSSRQWLHAPDLAKVHNTMPDSFGNLKSEKTEQQEVVTT